MLIVIEGVDGAGKRTLTNGLRAQFEAAGSSVATLAFPRYGHSVAADLAAEALHGGHGDLSSSVYAMAVLFALDRAGAHDEIGHLDAAYDVVILDRYVASNAAYSAARLHQGADGDVVEWVRTLEYERLHLPAPDWQVLLDVPTELAAERAEHRAEPRDRPRQGRLRARRRTAAPHRRGVLRARGRPVVRTVVGRRPRCERRRAGRRPGSIADSRVCYRRFIAIW